MIGKTILHYKIVEKLGEGGMGVVYKAEDTRLKREVAIKLLPHYISSNNEERKRFEIEAQAAASLNHPNIATIHAIEESGEQQFIVMEYVDGKELKSIVETHSRASLQNDDTINYAIQIAEGLNAAHKKGIVHRDIKSSNIMVTEDGKIKIMDFGLAKIGKGTQVTKFGSTVGTIAYMSPEQTRGDEIDHRTDIWSFGVVLYEMLTGKLPFKGEYDAAIIYSILNEEVQSPSKVNPNVPAALDKITEKCLKRDKEERYKNVDELINDLKKFKKDLHVKPANTSAWENSGSKKIRLYSIYGISVILLFLAAFFVFKDFKSSSDANANVNAPKRLAVLPFTNIKNDKENDYLSFALADQVIGSLSYIKNILVRPSSAIRKYVDSNINPSDAGKELKVEFILTGNYLKESDLVRLNLELVDARSNEIIWRNDFDVIFKNTFTLQDIVSEKVVSGLKIRFTDEEKHLDTPKDALAYEYYLKAVSYPLTNEAHNAAINILQKAIKLDPAYAPAYSELGFRYQMLSGYDLKSRDKIAEAEKSYLKALSINENLLAPIGNLASLYVEIGKTIEAVVLTKRALEINPNNANAHFWLGYIYRYTGLLEESAEEMETALKLDPHNPRFRSIGTTYTYMKRYEEAIKSFELDKDSPLSNSWIGVVYFRTNKIELAKKYLIKSINLDSSGTVGVWSSALIDYINGNKENGLEKIKTLETSNTYDGEQFFNYANLYALFGQKKDCLRTLKKAIDAGFYCYPLFANDIFLKSMRNEPEFKKLLSITKQKSDDFRRKISEL